MRARNNVEKLVVDKEIATANTFTLNQSEALADEIVQNEPATAGFAQLQTNNVIRSKFNKFNRLESLVTKTHHREEGGGSLPASAKISAYPIKDDSSVLIDEPLEQASNAAMTDTLRSKMSR